MIKIKDEILKYYYNTKEEATIEKITEFENEHEVIFPKKYKEFILNFNGAELDYPIFYLNINDEKYEICIWRILSLEENSGLAWANDEYGDELPKDFFIICHGDGFVIMNYKTEEVYFWDDEWMLPISNDEHNVYKIANNFKEFIDILIPTEGIEED